MDSRLRSVESRAADNAAVERGARYWRGYSPGHSFVEKAHPKAVSSRDKSKPDKVAVYFMRFRSKTNPTYSFLKIGITNHLGDRFGFDSHRYDREKLAMAHDYSRQEAREIEKRLHKQFSEWSHSPQVPLMSKGDTECFVDDPALRGKILAEFVRLKNVNLPLPVLDKRIHNLMLLLERNHPNPQSLMDAFRGNLRSLGVKVPSVMDLTDYYCRKIKNRPV